MSLAGITQNAAVPGYVGRRGCEPHAVASTQWWEHTRRPSRLLAFGAGRVFVLARGPKRERSQNEAEGLAKPVARPGSQGL